VLGNAAVPASATLCCVQGSVSGHDLLPPQTRVSRSERVSGGGGKAVQGVHDTKSTEVNASSMLCTSNMSLPYLVFEDKGIIVADCIMSCTK
jgi:hypothetical protein